MRGHKILCPTCSNFRGRYGEHPGTGDNTKRVVYVAPEGCMGVCNYYKHFAMSCDHYTPTELDFGEALQELRRGHSVARRGWKEKFACVKLHDSEMSHKLELTLPFIYMKTTIGNRVPWAPTQTDMLALDWYVVESKEAEE